MANDTNIFEDFTKSLKTRESRNYFEFMADLDRRCDLFKSFQVDCLYELMLIGISEEYKNRGISRELTKISIGIAEELARGVNVKQSFRLHDKSILGARPKIIIALCTSHVSAITPKKLGLEVITEISYEELECGGKQLSSLVIDKKSTGISVQVKKL